jgi:hypothetical protein
MMAGEYTSSTARIMIANMIMADIAIRISKAFISPS